MNNSASSQNGFGRASFGDPMQSPPAPTMMHTTSGRSGFHQAFTMLHQTSGRNVNNSIFSSHSVQEPSSVHNGVSCDGGCVESSKGFMAGVRYKCSTCANYDLCESCMAIHDSDQPLPIECQGSVCGPKHPRNHYFLRVPRDVGRSPPPVLVNRSNWHHPYTSCAECNAPTIIGYRYFCTTCGISFCESCEQQGLPRTSAAGVHHLSHNLLKMVPPPTHAPIGNREGFRL